MSTNRFRCPVLDRGAKTAKLLTLPFRGIIGPSNPDREQQCAYLKKGPSSVLPALLGIVGAGGINSIFYEPVNYRKERSAVNPENYRSNRRFI